MMLWTLCRTRFPSRPLAPVKFNLRAFSHSPAPKEIRYVRFNSPQEPPSGGHGGGGWRKSGRNAFLELSPAIKTGIVAGLLGGFYYTTHLEQVPDTGRWRFMNASPNDEAKAGEMVKREIQQTMGNAILPPNHPITKHVRRVVSRILAASHLGQLRAQSSEGGLQSLLGGLGGFSSSDSEFGAAERPNEAYGPEKEWDVIVVNDKKMVNAMAAPGVVVVFTGILPVCKDEEGLAAVLGHEIGHVVARHTAERMSSRSFILPVIIALQLLGIDSLGISPILSNYFLELPNSREQEREADLIGLRLMSRACYDPGAAPAMFERLGKVEEMAAGKGLEFFSTHPRSDSRAKILQQSLPDAYRILADNPQCAAMSRLMGTFKDQFKSQGIRVGAQGDIELV